VEEKEKKISIPMKVQEVLSDNKIEFVFDRINKEDLVKEFESLKANKDGCYCNPGGGGC